jgi:hypothetical protein
LSILNHKTPLWLLSISLRLLQKIISVETSMLQGIFWFFLESRSAGTTSPMVHRHSSKDRHSLFGCSARFLCPASSGVGLILLHYLDTLIILGILGIFLTLGIFIEVNSFN